MGAPAIIGPHHLVLLAIILLAVIAGAPRADHGRLSCPLLSGPSTITVWTKEGTTNACEEAQARGDYREAT
ncbi:hypothetical protein DC429_19040 [Arthrobacter sp. TPD3018]|nr:hypothetical protein BSZ14_12540 [Sphingomonas sp. Sph1(2015)]PVE49664.1 hypothetical protein DC429_19040 [Arthrobacter sp. TPD3018]PVE49858.1 hypothetical protein DC425_18835 [Sphingomonas sp. TPD3009]RSX14015.1 hypothetical protein DAH99_23055 [Sphingomonas koreensis]